MDKIGIQKVSINSASKEALKLWKGIDKFSGEDVSINSASKEALKRKRKYCFSSGNDKFPLIQLQKKL